MTDLIVVPQPTQWHKLKALVLDSVSSPITKRVYNLGLDEFFAWYGLESRPGFTKATVSASRVSVEARGLGSISISTVHDPFLDAGSSLGWVYSDRHELSSPLDDHCQPHL